MSEKAQSSNLLNHVTQIVTAYVSKNIIPSSDLPDLINNVHSTLTRLNIEHVANDKKLIPAVPISQSVKPDYIICLEDGKKMKMLKRHLRSYNLTPEEYREKWGLPANYPMVAPNYAKVRSSLAKQIGLGTKLEEEAS